MPRIVVWNEDEARRKLSERLRNAMKARERLEYRWEENERTIYSTRGSRTSPRVSYSFESDVEIGLEDVDNSSSEVGVSYAFKNLRFIHAQMSANPPTVVTRPTSNDQDDRRKADAADRLVRFALRQYRLQEKIDRASLNCLIYGTGIMKTRWNPHAGDLLEVNEETGEVLLEGEIEYTTPSPWHMYIDPDADAPEEMKWAFEKIFMPYDEALYLFGSEKEDELKRAMTKGRSEGGYSPGSNSGLAEEKFDSVELFEYWETGLPSNGYQGRFCYCLRDGTPLTPIAPNPHRFITSGAVTEVQASERLSDEQKEAKIQKLPKKAGLPYQIFTDIDVPDNVWGKSFIEYVAVLQDTMNKLDSSTLDNIQAHGVSRLVLPEGAEIADESITNSPWDIIKITGSQPPHYVNTPSIMPEVDQLRQQMKIGIDDMSGVNESMFGQQSREQSGFSMQYATNQGNMIRRRLFNKYVLFVEDVYRTYLNLVRKHWDTPKTISVLGKEKALESVEVQGTDIDGGFDIVVEYGASLSLDPMTRREEIMALQPLFEKAGIPTRVSLQLMKLNELEGLYDMLQLAEDRQREIFEEMIATGRYVPPEEFQDHENMIASAMVYFMTTEFNNLDDEAKELCKQHIRERAEVAAREAGGGGGGAMDGSPLPPGPVPAPPVDAGIPPEEEQIPVEALEGM